MTDTPASEPVGDFTPPPGRVPPKQYGLPEWLNRDVRPFYNESMVARRIWVIVSTAYRFRAKHGQWPTRRELINRVLHTVPKAQDFEDALDYLRDEMGHDTYIFGGLNRLGHTVNHYGFDRQFYAISGGKQPRADVR